MGERRQLLATSMAWLMLAGAAGVRAGAVYISGDDSDDNGHCQGTACGALLPTTLRLLYRQCDPVPTGREQILVIGVNGEPALSSFLSWDDINNGGPGAPYRILTDVADIQSVVFEDYRVIYLPSSVGNTVGGITDAQIDALDSRAADLKTYINDNNGRLMSLTQAGATGAYGWLPAPLTYTDLGFQGDDDIDPTAEMDSQFPGTQTNDTNMNHCCYHTAWTGPAGYSGLKVLAVTKQHQVADPSDPTMLIDGPVIVGGCNVKITTATCPDDANPDCWVCGNNHVDPGEVCDDGNVINGDGCDANCRPTPCLGTPLRIYPLKGVRDQIAANWVWPGSSDAKDGYRVYAVLVKQDLDWTLPGRGARGSNPGAIKECDSADPALAACVEADAFLPATPLLLFLQVIGVCSGSEGAN